MDLFTQETRITQIADNNENVAFDVAFKRKQAHFSVKQLRRRRRSFSAEHKQKNLLFSTTRNWFVRSVAFRPTCTPRPFSLSRNVWCKERCDRVVLGSPSHPTEDPRITEPPPDEGVESIPLWLVGRTLSLHAPFVAGWAITNRNCERKLPGRKWVSRGARSGTEKLLVF